jgi:hypothetical protein
MMKIDNDDEKMQKTQRIYNFFVLYLISLNVGLLNPRTGIPWIRRDTVLHCYNHKKYFFFFRFYKQLISRLK